MKEYIYKKLQNTIFCHGLPLEELVCHGRVLHREEGGEEEEAQEEEADDLCPPASQGQQASGQMRPGGWPLPLGKTPSWSSHPSAWTETTVETGTWG